MKIKNILLPITLCCLLASCNQTNTSSSIDPSLGDSSFVSGSDVSDTSDTSDTPQDKILNTDITIMSCNLDQGATGNKTKYNEVAEQIMNVLPDLFGVQEETSGWEEFLRDKFSQYGYEHVLTYRGGPFNEASGIFYSIDRFELIESGGFWLGQDPNAGPGYIASEWGAQYPRVCSYVILKDYKTEKTFAYFNTHYEHTMNVPARKKSSEQILAKIESLNMPAFFSGDLNFRKEDEPDTYSTIKEKMDDSFDAYEGEQTCTWHDYGKELDPATREYGFSPIDYIWSTKGDFKVNEFDVLTQSGDSFYSDHFFIKANYSYLVTDVE